MEKTSLYGDSTIYDICINSYVVSATAFARGVEIEADFKFDAECFVNPSMQDFEEAIKKLFAQEI
jgi:hypothetical protein